MTPQNQKQRDKKYWRDRLAPIAKNLRFGQRRVQRAGVARWLFDFAYMDIEALTAGQLVDLGFDILALVMPKDLKTFDERGLFDAFATASYFMQPEEQDIQKLIQLSQDVQARIITDDEGVTQVTNPILHPAHPHVPAWIVSEFHDQLRIRFEGMFAGHYWKHERPAEVIWILPTKVRPVGNVFNAESFENPAMQLQPVERLMLIAGDAIYLERGKFGVCARPKCGKPFMAEKNPLRKHCSDACAVSVRVERHRRLKRRREKP